MRRASWLVDCSVDLSAKILVGLGAGERVEAGEAIRSPGLVISPSKTVSPVAYTRPHF